MLLAPIETLVDANVTIEVEAADTFGLLDFNLTLEKSEELKDLVKGSVDISGCTDAETEEISDRCKSVADRSVAVDRLSGTFSGTWNQNFGSFLKFRFPEDALFPGLGLGDHRELKFDARLVDSVVGILDLEGPGLNLVRRLEIPEPLQDLVPVSLGRFSHQHW